MATQIRQPAQDPQPAYVVAACIKLVRFARLLPQTLGSCEVPVTAGLRSSNPMNYVHTYSCACTLEFKSYPRCVQFVSLAAVGVSFAVAGELESDFKNASDYDRRNYDAQLVRRTFATQVAATVALLPLLAVKAASLLRACKRASRQVDWRQWADNAAMALSRAALWGTAFGSLTEPISCEGNCMPYPDALGFAAVYVGILFLAEAVAIVFHFVMVVVTLVRLRSSPAPQDESAAQGAQYRALHVGKAPFLVWWVRIVAQSSLAPYCTHLCYHDHNAEDAQAHRRQRAIIAASPCNVAVVDCVFAHIPGARVMQNVSSCRP